MVYLHSFAPVLFHDETPNVAADEQRSAAENLFDDAECLLHPLVRPPAGGQADARSAATFTRPQGG